MKLWKKILIGVGVVLVVGVLAIVALLRTGVVFAHQFGWADRMMGLTQRGGYGGADNDGCDCGQSPRYSNNGPMGGGRRPMMGGGWQNQPDQGNNWRGMGPGMMDEPGLGMVAIDEWVTVEGQVTTVDSDQMIVKTSDGKEIEIYPQAWAYAQTEGFKVSADDKVSLMGFYDRNNFEAGKMTNVTSGESVSLRDDYGRPLWAGGGRWRK
jgi:uncharacterized protein YdeI (BOF family)